MNDQNKNIEIKLSEMMERWFISEPPLFQVLCMHQFVPNHGIQCPVRCGRRRIEYNPSLLSQMNDNAIEEAIKCEAIRILLKHPYDRRPEQCSLESSAIGSNLVINDNYNLRDYEIDHPDDYGLARGRSYEWYANEVQKQLEGSDAGDSSSTGEAMDSSPKDAEHQTNLDRAELWEEDDMTAQLINNVIKEAKDWGSLAGHFAELVTESLKAKIDWKKMLRGFRGTLLTSEKKLTRMKPNRRYGFEAMGNKREFCTRLLIAVDVSGSISTETLKYFYGVIESAFRYGFTQIDTLQFDVDITRVQSLQKPDREITVLGRGGTSFQKPILYAHEHRYDGLIILTDGYAPKPDIPVGMKSKILWICENERCYNAHEKWMSKLGRVTVMETDKIMHH